MFSLALTRSVRRERNTDQGVWHVYTPRARLDMCTSLRASHMNKFGCAFVDPASTMNVNDVSASCGTLFNCQRSDCAYLDMPTVILRVNFTFKHNDMKFLDMPTLIARACSAKEYKRPNEMRNAREEKKRERKESLTLQYHPQITSSTCIVIVEFGSVKQLY